MLATTVLIIGAGVTGTGLSRDLALRGIESIVVEKEDINAGASGGNHGLLHSGARYVGVDPMAASECCEEGKILKQLAGHCIEDTGGLFVAVAGDDEGYVADFPAACRKSGIPCREVSVSDALEMEPALSRNLIAAFAVPDASVDPFRLSLDNMAHAVSLGARFMPRTRLVALALRDGRIASARVEHTDSGEITEIEVKQVVNAAGAWAGEVLAMVGLSLDLIYSKGTLLVTNSRVARQVVNRLRPATDADILVPGGTVSVLGTTSFRASHPEDFRPTTADADAIINDAKVMIPALETMRYIRAYARIRPLIGTANTQDDRSVSRGFALFDHARQGVDNLATITGGKLTTFRLMAEHAADLLCARLGCAAPCQTRTAPIPSSPCGEWTEPGRAPREWLKRRDSTDSILCECELVPKSVVDGILKNSPRPLPGRMLSTLGGKTRIGKGSCQGGLCSLRVTAHLYGREYFSGDQGITEMKSFLQERWRGMRPVAWGVQAVQAELQEALHCGLFGLELADPEQ